MKKSSLLRIIIVLSLAVTARAYSTLMSVASRRSFRRRLPTTARRRRQESRRHDDVGAVVCRMTKSTASQQQQQLEQQQQQQQQRQPVGNILILDHLNINHEMGRHDWLKAFYFDFLACVVDPRKLENLEKGRKTIWANIGAQQFHLPESQPEAQVLQGIITLVYPNVDGLVERYSLFTMVQQEVNDDKQDASSSLLQVTDPWGTQFRIVQGEAAVDGDNRGKQPGGVSEGLAMRDLTLYTSKDGTNMEEGIARFYNQILGAPTLECTAEKTVVAVGPFQTLTFMKHPGFLLEEEEENALSKTWKVYTLTCATIMSNRPRVFQRFSATTDLTFPCTLPIWQIAIAKPTT
jgi:hypothetical protein